ncbi:MAG: InlB B-repeat-containing protein [Verrucomicrobiaceae bacterium]|nr:InlB B-repeat-containing protein [Verrucomicrobiaceae bacterium]
MKQYRAILSLIITLMVMALTLSVSSSARAQGIAYGSINNFDTVNDTGHECHGFEIEIEDCHSTDITYTYNYNHYGVPEISEDNSVAGHPKCKIRWSSKKNADGSWAAYTAIPSGPISPTNGHMFTNPNVNFGGEHFGVGYRAAVGAVKYNWLIDNGAGVLVNGGAVQVATPTFTYFPAVGVVAPQVQAVIAPPPPPAPPVKEFGKAVWVKEIKTTTHNENKIKLRELVSDDPADPNDKNWANGEPDEVEVEWRILQKKTSAADGGVNGELAAAPEELPNGNEVVTRRYEFYKYVGPLDAETGEAMGDAVGADGLHGSGTVTYADHFDGALGEWVSVTTDMATKVVVGDYTGAQMAAVDVEAVVGLIDHVGDAKLNTPFAPRTVVVEGALPFTATQDGALPPGMTFDTVQGVLSGTPTAAGEFAFQITASDGVNPDVSKNYTMTVAAAGVALPPTSLLDTSAQPVGGGTTAGDGSYDPGTDVTVDATPNVGFDFVNWTDNGVIVSNSASYTFTLDVNHSLVANFAPQVASWIINASANPVVGGVTAGSGAYDDGSSVTLTATPSVGYNFLNWTEGGVVVSAAASLTFTATGDRNLVANFSAVPVFDVTTSAAPIAGGATSGDGAYASGSSATVVATANGGYTFVNWTVGGTQVSTNASYTFTVSANKALVANFVPTSGDVTIATSSSPSAGGSTTGGGAYGVGDSVTVTATPNPGYEFSKWKEGGSTASNSASYTFTASTSRNLVASFYQAYYVSASALPAVGGSTEMDSTSYKAGETAQARATASAGYVFVNWTENGAVVSNQAIYSFNVTANRTLVAHFASATGVTITASALPVIGGSVSGDGSYDPGDSVTVSAVADLGYTFTNWTENGVWISSLADYTFTAAANRNLVANFIPGYLIAASAWPLTAGSVSGDGPIAAGASATLVATESPGYTFTNWTDTNGNEVSTSASYTFTPTANGDYTANFTGGIFGILFDFDTAAPALAVDDAVPFDQTSDGVTASFTAASFTVQTEASTGRALSKITGNYLEAGADRESLSISFGSPMTGVQVDFATIEAIAGTLPSDLKITALDYSTGPGVVVGSAIAHGTVTAGDSLPVGTLSFNSSAGTFDKIVIELAEPSAGAQRFLVDNVLASPGGTTGESMLLANPNWNITLTDFGYSDYCLDNTPGFEGREYLSGEWGSAVSYTRDGVAQSPIWLEPNFIFPDWQTNSNFHVVQAIHQVGTNIDGLPIAQSVLANDDLQITLRFEMVDTVTGTPMGLTPASSGSAANAIDSNRYVLSQSFSVKNISGVAITNVQLFQLLHGFTSQRGLYDDRVYSGKLSNYRFDVTLAGVDEFAVGTGSSDLGLEDYIAFHSKAQPTAFEIGYYGIEGNEIDFHSIGKPSEGVHLSIEDNWANAPYSNREGTDSFTPATRWVAGGQRWDLGDVSFGQSTSFDLVLSLLSGTRIDPGTGGNGGTSGSGSCNGGSGHVGGVDFEIEDVDTPGAFFGDYSEADDDEMQERENDGDFALPSFTKPGGAAVTQLWNLEFSGQHTGQIHLTFAYNPALLPAGFDEATLTIFHYNGTLWEELVGTVDTVHHTITVSTTSLSPFALGVTTPGQDRTISAASLPVVGGTVSGAGVVGNGVEVTLIATPAEGFEFAGWTRNGNPAGSNNPLIFTADANYSVVANFRAMPSIGVTSLPAAGGASVGGGYHSVGSSVTLDASPMPGFYFVNWTEAGLAVSTAASYTFTAGEPRTLVANFAPLPTLQMQPRAGGAGGDGVTFAWPSAFAGWVLEESPDLSPGSWVPSTRLIQTNGENKEIVVPQSDGTCFFRLVKP